MNLEPAPRLPKLPFFIADAIILGAAVLLAKLSSQPLDSFTIGIIAVLVIIGAGLAVAPFIAAHLSDENEQLDRERQRVNDQVSRLHAATESLSRAAAQIKAVEEAVHKAARDAETLPYRMQEKLAEFNEALASKEDSDREALETELDELRATNSDQLKAVADKIAKAAADWTALEIATRKQLATAQTAATDAAKITEAALAKFQNVSADATAQLETKIAAALREFDVKLVALQAAAASIPTTLAIAAPAPATATSAPIATPEAAAPATPVTAPEEDKRPAPALEPAPAAALETAPEPTTIAAPAESMTTEPAPAAPETPAPVEPPKPKKPRAPRKPKAEDTLLAMSTEPAAPATEPAPVESVAATVATPEPAPAPAPQPEPEPELLSIPESTPEPVAASSDDTASEPAAEPVESSTSSDGATRLLATAYIGIGNKLFIRGDGPGLSWDHGVPMQFVSIGKWGWFTHEAAGPIRCKLYKNDETAALTGEIVLEAGRHTEVTALF